MNRTLAAILLLVVLALAGSTVYLMVTGAVQSRSLPLPGGDSLSADRLAAIYWGSPSAGINVNGEGLVKAKPDLATTQVAVDVVNKDVVEAQRDAATRMDRVMVRLKELGIAAEDIKTSQYSISPQYDYAANSNKPTLTGYRVVNAISVNIRQLDKAGQILDAVIVAGATRVDGVSFTIADPTPLQSQARAAAVKQARARAEELAKSAGVTLGKVTSINESTAGAAPQIASSTTRAFAAADTSIAPGELEVRVSVQLSFGIQ
jgi:hypothetical protein